MVSMYTATIVNRERADSTLLERVASGDVAAVRDVVDTYGGLVWSLALRFTGSHADAEDAVQDIFVLLWRKAGMYDRSMGAEVTFVSVLARRLLIDRWRRAAARPVPTQIEVKADAPPTARAEFDEWTRIASAAFSELDEAHQTAVRLSIEHGRSHAEIADITGAPLGTVKSRIRNGLRRIRDRFDRPAPRPSTHNDPAGGTP